MPSSTLIFDKHVFTATRLLEVCFLIFYHSLYSLCIFYIYIFFAHSYPLANYVAI